MKINVGDILHSKHNSKCRYKVIRLDDESITVKACFDNYTNMVMNNENTYCICGQERSIFDYKYNKGGVKFV